MASYILRGGKYHVQKLDPDPRSVALWVNSHPTSERQLPFRNLSIECHAIMAGYRG